MDLEVVGSSPTSHPRKPKQGESPASFLYMTSMLSKRQLKELRAYRQSKYCKDESLFVVEGEKMAAEALASGWPVRVVCATATWMAAHPQPADIAAWWTVSDAELEQLSLMRTPNAVWMLVERQRVDMDRWNHTNITLVLDHIQDPGNMGTLIRTADWFGIRHIVCSTDSVDCFNPKVVQSTMGSLFRTQIDYVDLEAWIDHCGMPLYGAVLGGDGVRRDTVWERPCALVIGNESRGICSAVERRLTRRLTIPNIGGTAESLNAASAAAILMAMMAFPDA